ATTPRMSTYLVAFLVGDFECTSGSADSVPIRVCSTPDKIKLTPFALAAAEHFLTYYDTYFGIKYPMPKLDLIAIPDFEAGAMENFGAITYRETELLVDEKDSSVGAKKRVASVVAHEMAHQWFGDMVTMQWWDNLWLNEGFATWMQDKAAGEWHPDWHFPQDVADELDSTLNLDATRTTRPIRATADTPGQIQEMFDGISYGKAGAVIGMLEEYVTPEVFRQGVHNYLAAHLYANASAEDFWNAQTTTSKLPADRIMSSFVDKPGVPLLIFGNRQKDGYPVHQIRFFLGEHADDPQPSGTATGWTLPVCQKTSSEPACKLLSRDATVLPVVPDAPFFFPNAGDKGYYRIAYTPEQLRAITAVAETDLSIPERASFLGDRWALTRAGMENVGSFLDLALAVKSDPNPFILGTALDSISSIRTRIATPEEKDQLNSILRDELNPVWTRYQEPAGSNEPFEHQQIRAQIFQALGAAGDPAIVTEARTIVNQLLSGKKLDDDGLVDASVVLAAANGDPAFYDRLKTISLKADDPGLQTEALETLAEFRRPELVLSTLNYATSGQVRNQDSWVLIAIELSQPQTRDIAWPWIQAHWDAVKAQLTTGSGSQFIASVGSFCTVEDRNQVQSFFQTHPIEAADRALAKAIDSIDECIRLRKTQEPNLRAWLAAHSH
ncbi:MAG: M1 family metallopeptidase, partial [Janthinobacterium lividum]